MNYFCLNKLLQTKQNYNSSGNKVEGRGMTLWWAEEFIWSLRANIPPSTSSRLRICKIFGHWLVLVLPENKQNPCVMRDASTHPHKTVSMNVIRQFSFQVNRRIFGMNVFVRNGFRAYLQLTRKCSKIFTLCIYANVENTRNIYSIPNFCLSR